MAASSAKSGKKTSSSSKSTKKKTTASSSKKREEQSSEGLGLGTILDVVGQLASSGSGNGKPKKKPKADENPLTALLSSFLGGGDSGGSIDYAAIIETLLPLLLSNKKHADSFKSNPSKTIKQLTGVNVSEQHLGPIVEQLLGKLNSK